MPLGSRCSHLHLGWLVFSRLVLSWLLWVLLLVTLHVVSVSVGNADKVGVGDAESGGLGKNHEQVEFL